MQDAIVLGPRGDTVAKAVGEGDDRVTRDVGVEPVDEVGAARRPVDAVVVVVAQASVVANFEVTVLEAVVGCGRFSSMDPIVSVADVGLIV